jgi:hypothetical protein
MKILYAEGNFLDKGHQILAYPAAIGDSMAMDIEKLVSSTVPEAVQSVHNMFAENEQYTVVPPRLGDVIWTETSGSKWYAHCIVYDELGEFSHPAFELCVKSISKKADELQHAEIGMPLQWISPKKLKTQWQRLVDVIEDTLGDETNSTISNKQAYVYDPSTDLVLATLDGLPGGQRAFYSDIQIRFKKVRHQETGNAAE